jgi:putative endonuclease
MSKARVKLGRRGEELAADALVQRGYQIVERNWYAQIGEVDVVARRDGAWSFFEVRTRRGRAFGTPEESITLAKRERMVNVARLYLAEHDLNVYEVDWRIGVVAVEMDEAGHLLRIEVYEHIW